MTNRERFDNLSNAEVAILLGHKHNNCMCCSYDENYCFGKSCVDGIKEWLDAPSKSTRKKLAVIPNNPPAENVAESQQEAPTERKPDKTMINNPPADNVNHPAHYTFGQIEVIDFIEDKHLGFHLGNAVKYISRAGRKDPAKTIEDLRKAAWYLNRQIERLERELGGQN